MYSSKGIRFTFLLVMTFLGEDVMACSCSSDTYAEQIEKTEGIVVHEVELVESYGILKGNLTSACALVRFKIDGSGQAVGAEVIESIPSGVLDRAALKTLSLYKFLPSGKNLYPHYYLVFEHSI